MGEFIAAVVTLGTIVGVVAAIFQVMSHPQTTATLTQGGTNVVDTTVQQLFK